MIGHIPTMLVAKLAPGDDLIQERLGGLAHTPPSRAGASRIAIVAELAGIPALVLEHRGDDLVRAEVTEVQVGREPAGCLLVGVVATLAVARQALAHELSKLRRRSDRATSKRRSAYGVIDRQLGDEAPCTPELGCAGD